MRTDINVKHTMAIIGFFSGFLMVALKLFLRSSLQIVIEGEQISSHNIGSVFTFQDVAVLLVASFLMGITLSYLLISMGHATREQTVRTEQPISTNAAEVVLNERKKNWENTALSLGGQEAMIYDLLISSDGIMLQSDIVSALNISKSTVSRILDLLESKGLVEKRRRGMGNLIMLR
ncbi:MAG TPA: MarR family transcriptional regulator [Candidatus Methanofastidiosa archaeon]|nr:MarR family transcriptional regulator [Candidatus Methanofastidiosa archaeon]